MNHRKWILAGIISVVFLFSAGICISQDTGNQNDQPVLSSMVSNMASCDARQAEPNLLAVTNLLQAARRLNKSNADAASLLAESLEALGDKRAAVAALNDYISLEPEDEVALAKGISLGLESLQTSEDRRIYLMQLLNQPSIPTGVKSVMCQELSRLSFEAAQDQAGREFLSQAMSNGPFNIAACQKALELMGPNAPPGQRLGLLVQMVRANPLNVQVVWNFANTLDDIGLSKEAQKWYKYALGVHLAGASGKEISGQYLLDLGASYVLSGDYDQAAVVLGRVLEENQDVVDGQIWLARAAAGRGQSDQAQMHLAAAEKILLAQAQAEPANPQAMVKASWFYIQDQPDKEKAALWVGKALALDPNDSRAQFCQGLVQLAEGKSNEAQQTLTPLARREPWAGLALIRIMIIEKASQEDITKAIQEAIGRQPGGWVGLATRELAKSQNVNLDMDRYLAQLAQSVDNQLGNQAEMRDFYRHPQDYLYVKIQPIKADFSYGEPITVNVSLTNMASIPISMGPGMMLTPRLLLSARLTGGLETELKHYDFVSLYQHRLLGPHEGLSQEVRLDRGQLGQLLRRCPQETVVIHLSAILDPQVVGQDEYLPSLGGQVCKEVAIVRYGFRPGPATMDNLYRQLKDAPMRSKVAALMLLGDLLGNSQSPNAIPIAKKPMAIDEQAIITAMVEAGKDRDWRVRAWLGEALRYVRLDDKTGQALAEQIHDENWFVRLMAVRATGSRGQEWSEVLRNVAKGDSEELVRQMAVSFVGTE